MCPLRIILIFLSATLAGFFVLRNLKSQSNIDPDDDGSSSAGAGASANDNRADSPKGSNSLPLSSQVPIFPWGSQFVVLILNFNLLACNYQVYGAIGKGFWTCVDMASGKYLWRHLVSSPSSNRTDWSNIIAIFI